MTALATTSKENGPFSLAREVSEASAAESCGTTSADCRSVGEADQFASLVNLWNEWRNLKDRQQDLDQRRGAVEQAILPYPCITIDGRRFYCEQEIVRFVDPWLRAAAIEELRSTLQRHAGEAERCGLTAIDAALEEIDRRLDRLHEVARCLPARSIADLTVLLDLALEYDVQVSSVFYEDRLDLEHLVAELRRLAPEIETSALRRQVQRGVIEAPPATDQAPAAGAAMPEQERIAGFV